MKKIYVLQLLILSSLFSFGQNEFAFELFEQLKSDKNTLFSPVSVKTAFAMAYEGAKTKTQSEFETVFDFEKDNAPFLEQLEALKKNTAISNSIWIQDEFEILKTYILQVEQKFGAPPYHTDFMDNPEKSANKINEWIEKSTKGMITKMLSADAIRDFKLAIINAIYFKKNWKKTFDKKQTTKKKFTNTDKSTVKVDMMHKLDFFNVYQGEKEKVIELPYEGDETSMIIILPTKAEDYELTNTQYAQFNALMYQQKVNLNFPKFTFETKTFELKSYLKKMGLVSAFSNSADFSGMRKEKDLKIGTVLHKAKIIVNEEGTEAAAATVIGVIQTTSVSPPPKVIEFNVNKPFYYIIKDNQTNTILFLGQMNTMEAAID